MSSCGHSTTFCFLPPTLTFLKENFPSLPRDTSIDRSLLRCRLCDLVDTQYAADLAEIGPPNLENEVDLQKQIADLKQAITEGSQTDTENALPKLQRKLSDVVRATDERIIEVWMRYWAVWGPGDGPQRGDEEFGEEDDFDIEFPPEETVAEKSTAEKAIPKKEVSNKAAPKKLAPQKNTQKTVIPEMAAPKQVVSGETIPEEAAPKVDRKRKVAANVDSSPSETTVKPANKRGRAVS
ncbi:hypothetical protein BKA64DRAFT_75336 [Cadophora sp. MPI-SDFR-AT-0126]|nr:hypothetical protein BKA64DRAFT_75336 [Leotiomycetes sp. MPI-SDFR-AT-0126]